MSVVLPKTFGDDLIFDENSPPEKQYNDSVDMKISTPIIVDNSITAIHPTTDSCKRFKRTQKCNNYEEEYSNCDGKMIYVENSCLAPWPSIIIGILGGIIVVYTTVAPGISGDRRVFGAVIMVLWTAVWALILWVLWKEGNKAVTWWLLLIPIIVMVTFFILIIVLDIGSSF